MKSSVAILFLFAICCPTALAIKCIICNSGDIPKCHDAKGLQGEACPEPSAEEKQLGTKAACFTIVFEAFGQKVTIRKCSAQVFAKDSCEVMAYAARNNPVTLKECTSCGDDNCNGPPPQKGNGNKLAAWTPVLGALVAALLKLI